MNKFKILTAIGDYMMFLKKLFFHREPFSVYIRNTAHEMVIIGVESVTIVFIISAFIGAVTVVQFAYNLENPLIPRSVIGLIVRDMTILELAPTITAIVLAGKVGSNMAGSLGTMKITEQIDAIEIMGINSASYLVLPKIIASAFMFPVLVTIAAFISITGGYFAGTISGAITEYDYVYGIREYFVPYNIFFMLVKSFVFALLISSICSYVGYNTKGGALEVGRATTVAVTNSCIAVLCADYVLAQILL
ncbi:MAG: ABC transporter permease [Bacteroidetes bacterium RIFCSPLOWO2_02_FULL_36_8]|nr:MAG: ABC transporter permease [Bacteroidetes bacterium RIFCSPLOWO2_02_FULL_36_8]OFY69228.1 MAG: ABC transporter permease [Bacteroidetes bacterium RIFCSPLOWO2_12_FULL_37_12]